MSIARAAFAGCLVLACAVHAPAQSNVTVTFDAGHVTLSARNAPLRAILAEWARVGGARIVNAERIAGQPLTLELTNVSERDALNVLLRSVSGYIVAERADAVAGRSSFDRIFILPTSAPVRTAPAVTSATSSAPNPVVFLPATPDGAGDPPDGLPRTAPVQQDPQQIQQQLREAAERAAALREATETIDQDEPAPPGSRPTPATPFGGVQGSTRPGEISPVPQQQTQPGAPRR